VPGLTALQVKNAKPGRHADGRGLYLMVRESGSRSWVFRALIDGKRQDLGLGAVGKLSLAQARSEAAALRIRIQAGEAVRPPKVAAVEVPAVPTFAEAARACHAAIKGGWANKRHSASWLSSLEQHSFPVLGSLPVDQVASPAVRDTLAPIWLAVPETARRVLQRIGTVLDFAHLQGWRPHEAALRSVPKGLPRQPVDDNHYAAMPYEDVPALMTRLRALPDTAGRDALLFTILNASRSGETRLATWSEIDLSAATWTIPAARMKMKRQHVVPLTGGAISILRRRHPLRLHDNGLVFSTHGTRPLSDMTMTKVLRDLGLSEITVHGFRSSFTDWAAEKTNTPKEVVDKALAHKLVDRVEAAYRRTGFFDRRRRLMMAWSHYAWSGKSIDDKA
jgi:integrase